jgi:TRAP-type mannitol/chloroaromatic compound transport system permease small subunit
MIVEILSTRRADWFHWETEAEGQGLVEYSLVILFIAIGCLVALTGMADAVQRLWNLMRDILIPAMGG